MSMFSPALNWTISASVGSASTASVIALAISRPMKLRSGFGSGIDDHLADAQIVDLAIREPEADGVPSLGRLADLVDDDAVVTDHPLVHVEGGDHVERHVLLGRAWHGSSFVGKTPLTGRCVRCARCRAARAG